MKYVFRYYLVRYKYIIALVVFGVLIGFVGDHCLVKRYQQKQEIAKLESEIQNQVSKFNQDKEQLEQLKNDSEAIEHIAREKYYMKCEDEDIFVIED